MSIAFLTIPEGDALVDAAAYLRSLCLATTRSCLEPIGSISRFSRHPAARTGAVLAPGMAVHELMMNAARHACFDGRAGEIRIKLSLAHPLVTCIVADNGTLSARMKPARGLGLVRDLSKSLGGRLDHGSGAEYASFRLVFCLPNASGGPTGQWLRAAPGSRVNRRPFHSVCGQLRHHSPDPPAFRRACMSRAVGRPLLVNRAPGREPSRPVHSSDRSRSASSKFPLD